MSEYRDSKLFCPWSLGDERPGEGDSNFARLRLGNRVVMAPMTRRMAAEDGIVTDNIVAYYRRRAANEVGLIISEGTGIDSTHAYDTLTVPRFETAEHIAGWQRAVDAIHEESGAFAPQLWHCGRASANPIGPVDEPADSRPPKPDGSPRPTIRGMVEDDFRQVIGAYEHAARESSRIGCDALEIHGAHGYLLDSFVAPTINTRTDDFGDSLENRMRFPLDVVRAVRAAVGPDFPIIYRFSQWQIEDYDEVKFPSPDELAVWVHALREAGVDILHVSTRSATDAAFPEKDATKTLAGWSRELSGLPVIAVGKVSAALSMDETRDAGPDANAGVSDPGPMLELIERGEADLLAVGRSLIANPDWVRVVRDRGWRELQAFEKGMLDRLD